MNWGEIQLASIRKMFLNTTAISEMNLDEMRTDKKYLTYIDGMPDAANEGIRILVTRGKPLLKIMNITKDYLDDSYPIEGYYTFLLPELPIGDIENPTKPINYLEIDAVYVDGGEYYDYVVRDNNYLFIPKDILDNHSVMISYKSYPDKITSTTLATDIIDLPIDMLNILPLYMASELYKDDDIALSTYYRNQFETELENMTRPRNDMHFTSVNGWL